MGVGNSLDASFTLRAPLQAGTWNLVGDGLITGDQVTEMQVTWELYLSGPDDTTLPILLGSWDHVYVRNPNARFDAVKYEEKLQLQGGGKAGDRLRLHITPQTGGATAFFLPNGDGVTTNGRIPHLDLP